MISDCISQGNQASSGVSFATEETSFSVRRRNFSFLGIHSRERKSANLFTLLAPKSQFQITFTFDLRCVNRCRPFTMRKVEETERKRSRSRSNFRVTHFVETYSRSRVVIGEVRGFIYERL